MKKAREIVNPPGGQADLWKKINRTGQFQNRMASIIFWHKIALPRGLPHKKRPKRSLLKIVEHLQGVEGGGEVVVGFGGGGGVINKE